MTSNEDTGRANNRRDKPAVPGAFTVWSLWVVATLLGVMLRAQFGKHIAGVFSERYESFLDLNAGTRGQRLEFILILWGTIGVCQWAALHVVRIVARLKIRSAWRWIPLTVIGGAALTGFVLPHYEPEFIFLYGSRLVLLGMIPGCAVLGCAQWLFWKYSSLGVGGRPWIEGTVLGAFVGAVLGILGPSWVLHDLVRDAYFASVLQADMYRHWFMRYVLDPVILTHILYPAIGTAMMQGVALLALAVKALKTKNP